MPLTLTPEQLADLTGYKLPSHQIKWLRDRHWRYELTRAGRPKVDREYYLMKMGVTKDYTPPVELNWDAVPAR
jgi:hypothetical protein